MEKGLLEKAAKTCSYWGSKLCLGLKRTGKTAGKINDCFDSFWGSELSLWLITWYILKEIGKCWKNLEKPGTLRWSVSASPPFDSCLRWQETSQGAPAAKVKTPTIVEVANNTQSSFSAPSNHNRVWLLRGSSKTFRRLWKVIGVRSASTCLYDTLRFRPHNSRERILT